METLPLNRTHLAEVDAAATKVALVEQNLQSLKENLQSVVKTVLEENGLTENNRIDVKQFVIIPMDGSEVLSRIDDPDEVVSTEEE